MSSSDKDTGLENPKLVDITTHLDARGALGAIQMPQLPFAAKRLYFLYDLKVGQDRGLHAHKALRQFMICMTGAVEVRLWDGRNEFEFKLEDQKVGLYVPSGIWREITPLEDGAVLAILASELYDRDDYIFSKPEFLQYLGLAPNLGNKL